MSYVVPPNQHYLIIRFSKKATIGEKNAKNTEYLFGAAEGDPTDYN